MLESSHPLNHWTQTLQKQLMNYFQKVLKSSKIAVFSQVDGYTITMYNNGNKGERHV